MNDLTVIIPSKNAKNFIACAEAVRKCEPKAKILLIDDGIDRSFLPRPDLMPCYGITGEKPFIFARNCNLGIDAADPADVVLLNDDAILQTHGGLSLMQAAARANPDIGIIAATTNNVGNINQRRQKGNALRIEKTMVCFICVLIPRRTIEQIGHLDERYRIDYGCEDNDYCEQVRRAGLRIGIHDGCFVDHGSLQSTFRGDPTATTSYKENYKLFKQKWGLE